MHSMSEVWQCEGRWEDETKGSGKLLELFLWNVIICSRIELGLLKSLANVEKSVSCGGISCGPGKKQSFPGFSLVGHAVVTLGILVELQPIAASQSYISLEFFNTRKANNIWYSNFVSLRERMCRRYVLGCFWLQVAGNICNSKETIRINLVWFGRSEVWHF